MVSYGMLTIDMVCRYGMMTIWCGVVTIWLSWYGKVCLLWYGYLMVWYGGCAGGMAMACRRGNHPFLLAVIIDLPAQDEISGNASP